MKRRHVGLLYSLLYGKSTFSSSPSADFSTLQVIAADTKRLKKKKKGFFQDCSLWLHGNDRYAYSLKKHTWISIKKANSGVFVCIWQISQKISQISKKKSIWQIKKLFPNQKEKEKCLSAYGLTKKTSHEKEAVLMT